MSAPDRRALVDRDHREPSIRRQYALVGAAWRALASTGSRGLPTTMISGWRRRISSKMATGCKPGALWSSGTTSLSQTSPNGSGRRRVRGAFFCDGSCRSCSKR
jgi:hypothetical protein